MSQDPGSPGRHAAHHAMATVPSNFRQDRLWRDRVAACVVGEALVIGVAAEELSPCRAPEWA